MGLNGHVLTFPVNHGNTLNVVAFKTTSEQWPDAQRLTKPAERKDLLHDFQHYGPNVIKLLELTEPNLDIVSRIIGKAVTLLTLSSGRYLIWVIIQCQHSIEAVFV